MTKSVMLGRTEVEGSEQNNTPWWHGWRLENRFCHCLSCDQGHTSSVCPLSPCQAYTWPLSIWHARWYRTVVWDRRACDWGVGQETSMKPTGLSCCLTWRNPTIGQWNLPGLVEPGDPGTALQRRHYGRVVCLADTLECICTVQCVLSFSSIQRENMQPQILIRSGARRGNYACWLSLFFPPSRLFLVCKCVQHLLAIYGVH